MTENNGAIVPRGFMNPTTVQEGMELAAWIAKSDLAPKDYKDKPQNVLLAMQMGFELGLLPLQAIQNIAVIAGRPSVWGDAMLGICQNHRDFESIDENQSTHDKGVCIVKRRGMEPQRREFTVEDAKKAGLLGKPGPWQTAPTRMLKLRARAFALRDTFADALRGLQSAEEQRDVIDTTEVVPVDVPMPQRASDQAKPKPPIDAPQVDIRKCITMDQAKRYFAIARAAGRTDDDIKAHLKQLGIGKTSEMDVSVYDAACEQIGKRPQVVDTKTGEIQGIELESPLVGQ